MQQTYPEALLMLPHRMAEGRGCDTEPLCGRPKAPMIGSGDERSQINKVKAMYS
jgi:hypothetical protein